MKTLANVLVAVAVLNFFAFMLTSLAIGGDAINGKIEGGKYYLGSHSQYTEVPRATFEYSKIHARSVWITHPLAFVGILILVSLKKDPDQKPAS